MDYIEFQVSGSIVPKDPLDKYADIDLVPNKQQTIPWINDGTFWWHFYASPDRSELIIGSQWGQSLIWRLGSIVRNRFILYWVTWT